MNKVLNSIEHICFSNKKLTAATLHHHSKLQRKILFRAMLMQCYKSL